MSKAQTEDKFDAMALIAGPIAGLKPEQLPGLAHIFRSIAKDERKACARMVDEWVASHKFASDRKTYGDEMAAEIAAAIRARKD